MNLFLIYLIKLFIYSIAVFIISRITNLIYIKNFKTALLFSFVVGLVNVLIKPIFVFITFPITILTLGIFLIFINGLMLMIASAFIKEVEVKGCFAATIASILISIIVYIFTRIVFFDKLY